MKIGISCDTNNQTYDIPDFWNIEFGDKEALAETRFSSIGQITNANPADPTLKNMSLNFKDLNSLVITIYNDDGVAIYTQICNRLIYAIRRVNTENNFIESLYFVS
jgi:hypothetical protein